MNQEKQEIGKMEEQPTYEGGCELKDTAKMMTSSDYRIRFIAEYVQLKIRYEKLKHILTKWEALPDKQRWESSYKTAFEVRCEIKDWLGFEPSCSFELLKRQQEAMASLLHILELRAAIEGIDLRSVTVRL